MFGNNFVPIIVMGPDGCYYQQLVYYPHYETSHPIEIQNQVRTMIK